ncbi:MAG TPA: glycosyltransferase family 4 protein [Candidatus Acidoferrales bacterium]|nr:glycosyltransferase family 4 protein [Candidatus Acidoferrales bacterium]
MIIALFPELLASGGVQLAGRQLAAALTSIAAEVGSPFHALSLNDETGQHESSVGNLRFSFQGFQKAKFQYFLSAMKLARSRPQIILAAHPNLAPIAFSMKFLAGKPRVTVCAHGIEVWHPLPLIRLLALRRADRVLAPSTDTGRNLVEAQLIAKEKVRKLPWPLDPDFLLLTETAGALPLPEGFPRGIIVLSVGRWAASESYKGSDLLIDGVSELSGQFPDLHLVLVGAGDDVPRLRALAKNSRCAERIHFLSNLTREALVACYAHADIFALPSSGEGFGFVFLEAMAMKKPVVGAAAGGVPDILQNCEAGFLIDPQDPSSLTAALRKLITSPELRVKMGQRGFEIVRTRFKFENFQRDLRSILCADALD